MLATVLLIFSTGNAQSDSSLAEKGRDTIAPKSKGSVFTRKKGLLGKLAKSITTDTTQPVDNNLQRIDLLYRRFKGKTIRKINVQLLDFGVPINDTLRSFKNKLTRLADYFHHTTREYVIRNNLFFKQYDTLLPYLIADNERHLRDQVYLGDARILVEASPGTQDSVDVTVLIKDVLSLGGAFKVGSLQKVEVVAREDNFMGLGDRVQFGTLYDYSRRRKLGYGGEYITRNIGGSFVDGYFGYQNYASALNTGAKQETTIYTRFIKPLVNPYMKWTYAFEGAYHKSSNLYFSDSIYKSDLKYQYYNIDAWVGLNFGSRGARDDGNRLRTLVGVRFLHQAFHDVPGKYEDHYNYQYADLTGVLASMSIFQQNFYKTQYIYGFGRNEDVPEGVDVSITTGLTNKQQRVRPYTGIDLSFNYFSSKKHYFNYTFRLGGYSYKKKYEDISALFNIDFFSRLRQISRKWKQRSFLTANITTQINKQLNEPLLLESQYGLTEYQNISLGGVNRLTVKGESVFYNDLSVASFRFAPFVFGNMSFLTPEHKTLIKTNVYQTIGAGLRSRNESLVFGTLELRAYYFTRKNFNNERVRVDFNTNIKFKYNSQFIRRPQFIVVN